MEQIQDKKVLRSMESMESERDTAEQSRPN